MCDGVGAAHGCTLLEPFGGVGVGVTHRRRKASKTSGTRPGLVRGMPPMTALKATRALRPKAPQSRGECLQVGVVIVSENGPDNQLKLTMLAEYVVEKCADGRAQSEGPWEAYDRPVWIAHSSQDFLLRKSPGLLVCGRRSRAESTRNPQQTSA